jgi:catechol 2,3-dioxygenase-like lactoylglutathione lyase family enzyme
MRIHGLHHNAYRCRDSEETRKFYEDFLGLPLVNAFEINQTKSGRATRALHSFYAMADGACLAFFEAPEQKFNFKAQHDFDLHVALEVPISDLEVWLVKAKTAGMECRGVAQHQMVNSIYLRDPNGYVIELAGKRPNHDEMMDPSKNLARSHLNRWQGDKSARR